MSPRARRWPIGRLLMTTHLPFVMLGWIGLVALAGLLLVGVAIFGTVRISTMDAAGQVLRWFAFGYGAYLVHTLLPIYLVHGQTRREYLRQAPVFQLVSAGALAGLHTIGYAAETLLYRANDWPQALSEDRLYDNASQYPLIFISYWGMLLVWTLTGSFVGAGFYRLGAGGVLLLPVALGLLMLSAVGNGFMNLPFIDVRLGALQLDVPAAVGVTAGCAVLALALAWALARDMPLRTRTD